MTDHEKISDCIDRIVDYAERSLPVLNDAGELVGIITSADVVELVDDEMGDDYAKLGGLTGEEDLNEGVFESVKKRLPWLIALLFLGMLVSSVVGAFESVVAVLPIVICFQSMVLDMAGNVGTQSLAVTIRVLVDENLTTSKKLHLLWKEMRVGLVNGALLRSWSAGLPRLLYPLLQSLCVGAGVPALRLRRCFPHRGDGHFQPGGYGHPHAVP